jgi:hypothetical protein
MDGINDFSSLRCSAEWHIEKLGCKHALAIYQIALRVAFKSGRFSVAYPTLATYFNAHERTIRRAVHGLREIEFFELLSREPGHPVVYRPILHKPEWMEKHPNACIEKIAMPWDGEGDLLGRELFSLCDGRIKFFYPAVMKGMRSTGFSDLEIAAHMKRFRQVDVPTSEKWTTGFIGRFVKYLKEQRETTNNPGQPCPEYPGQPCPEVGPAVPGVPRPQVAA